MEYTNQNFRKMRDGMIAHFTHMSSHRLFRVDADTEELWKLYLASFPEEIQGIYREKAWHDCTVCRRWFRKMANVVSIDGEGNIISLFKYDTIPEYQDVFNALHQYIEEHGEIKDVFLTSQDHFGLEYNFEGEDADSTIRHDHFYLEIPQTFIRNGVKVGSDMSKVRTDREVFERTLQTINVEAVDTLLDLIADDNLYRGREWKNQLTSLRRYIIQYQNVDDANKNNWCWQNAAKAGTVVARMKNHSIGVLLQELSEGKPLEQAMKRYEQIVAPANYRRPKPLFTQAMLDNAKATLDELGYLDSIQRRYAVMSDLNVKDVLFANRDLATNIQGDIFDELSKDAIVRAKNFDYVEEVPVQDFIDNILPKAQEVSLYLDHSLTGNFVSLISPINNEAPSIFKWNNCMSWTYKNNLADSMKEQVKAMGGDIDVDLRFSIRWNDGDVYDGSDLDAHCTEPVGSGNEIYYRSKKSPYTGGWLDVDIIYPTHGIPAVENIRFKNKAKMVDGAYLFRVHQFNEHPGNEGFEAEIEFDGQIYNFYYPVHIRHKNYVDVAEVTLKDGNFTLNPLIDPEVANKEIWNVQLHTFVPVSLVCYSPNYWGDNAVGNQHLFFMLQDCKNDDRPNPWFNEYLNEELHEHRKVMEALSTKARVEESDNQLSGVGFSLTLRNEVTLKVVIDNVEKLMKIKI